MKKSLLVLILAVAMVVPVFAAKGDMSIDAKLGLGLSNNLKNTYSDENITTGYKMEMPFSIGAEFFYGLMDNLSIGAGINYNFGSKVKYEDWGAEIKTTNFYVSVKPEAKIESDIFSSIYLIGQIGGSSINFKDDYDGDYTMDVGLYLGFGAGVIIKDNFIVELVISSSNGKKENSYYDGYDYYSYTTDVQYTATTLNIGYKFNI